MSASPDTAQAPTVSEVESSLIKLNDALIGHSKWLTEWNTRIICGIKIEPPYISEDSHRACFFGRWYYDDHAPFLLQNSAFKNMEALHNSVHNKMRDIVSKTNNKQTISREEYQLFIDAEISFSKSLITLRDWLYKLLLSFDYLTGTLNRQAFFYILEQERSRIIRHTEKGCLVLLDIDRFKAINDNFGHVTGDKVLTSVSRFIIKNLRPYDFICRYGGEEFLIFMPNTTLDISHKIIDRLREELSKEPISVTGDQTINISASFGIAAMSTKNELSITIDHADKALYEAKKGGRNKVSIWDKTNG